MTILLALLLALAGQPATAAGSDGGPWLNREPVQRGCPPDHRNSGSRVRMLLTSPLIVEMRSRFDLGRRRRTTSSS